ncbi:hypothetical protein N781_08150 [Pontibacillus halophilus JSM 076056 = DSM 19796]|uniref:Transposase n=1 Tax=Pontibacillus halophilus JSM 076056 = DSM 19796 TaxID=1385510 RepID=A0A0A5GGL1_9BACI|nr:hypothetical protein N781_08150 [Pontibacillus halophilus JSM 076056 = DSM 19796]
MHVLQLTKKGLKNTSVDTVLQALSIRMLFLTIQVLS